MLNACNNTFDEAISADTEFLAHTAIGDSCNSQNKDIYASTKRKPRQQVIICHCLLFLRLFIDTLFTIGNY
jgi:hypothetical protein